MVLSSKMTAISVGLLRDMAATIGPMPISSMFKDNIVTKKGLWQDNEGFKELRSSDDVTKTLLLE
jgi:hypothetical protein